MDLQREGSRAKIYLAAMEIDHYVSLLSLQLEKYRKGVFLDPDYSETIKWAFLSSRLTFSCLLQNDLPKKRERSTAKAAQSRRPVKEQRRDQMIKFDSGLFNFCGSKWFAEIRIEAFASLPMKFI